MDIWKLLTIISLASGDRDRDNAEMTGLEDHYHLPKLCLLSLMGKAGPWPREPSAERAHC